MKVILFGKEIKVRDNYCQVFDKLPQPVKNPYVNLYVKFKGCNATCKFCDFQCDANHFNDKKYLEVLNEIKNNVFINKIAFTGGEPTLNFDQFSNILNLTHQTVKTYLSLNTNGLNLNKVLDISDKLNCISLSRHHYKDKLNNEIFGFKAPSTKILKEITCKDKMNITCNLVKGYIDSKKEILKYLEYVSQLGIKSMGLVSLMPINDFCKENEVDFSAIELRSKRFNLTKYQKYENYCQCNNWVYFPKKSNNTIKIYYKWTYNPYEIDTNLVFDGEYLTKGFTKEIIY